MHLSTLRALTWGTVAAAMVSALWLAAEEFAGGDHRRDDVGEGARGLLIPGDATAAGGGINRPAQGPGGGSQPRRELPPH